jgi:hypothetical protein
MKKCGIVLIHNMEVERVPVARNIVFNIKNEICSEQVLIECFEIYLQPEVDSTRRKLYAKVRWAGLISQLKYFSLYLKSPIKYWLGYFLRIFTFVPSTLFVTKRDLWRASVDALITGKHYQAWKLGQKLDLIIVLEADVVQTSGLSEISKLVSWVLKIKNEQPIFIDLAGGFPAEQIAHKTLIQTEFLHGLMYANTACGYMVNTSLCNYLIRDYESNKTKAKLGVDFFLNSVFMNLPKKIGICHHSISSGIGHGSFLGEYDSWTLSD